MELNKEEIRKKFEEFQHSKSHNHFGDLVNLNNIFDFFYQEIEAREKGVEKLWQGYLQQAVEDANKKKMLAWDQMQELLTTQADKISELQALLLVADEVIGLGYSPESTDHSEMGENDKYYEALEKYNQLKAKQ